MCTENFTRSRWWNSCVHRARCESGEVWFGQNNCLAISSRQFWLASTLFTVFKGQFLRKNFSEFFKVVSLFSYQCSFRFVISSPEQLWYHIMLFSVCQQLFYFFELLFFSAAVFLSSEINNTTCSVVCQQLFWIFLIFIIASAFYTIQVNRIFAIRFATCS